MELHDLTDAYPPAEESVSVKDNWLFKYQRFHAIWITNLIPFLGLVAAIVLSIRWGVHWPEMMMLGLMYVLTILGIEVGFHRLFAHQSFSTHRWVEQVFAVLGCMGAQGPVIYWVANHRRHHRHSDTNGDPHSPYVYNNKRMGLVKGLLHAHVNWQVWHQPPSTSKFAKDLLKRRHILAVNRYYFLAIGLGLVVPAVVCGLVEWSLKGALMGFLWGGLARIFILNQVTFSINSFCHVFGTKPFKTKEGSRNMALLALPTFGQSWHNNHHAFSYSSSVRFKPMQVDLAGAAIRVLSWTGLAWDLKKPDRNTIESRMRFLDQQVASSPSTTQQQEHE